MHIQAHTIQIASRLKSYSVRCMHFSLWSKSKALCNIYLYAYTNMDYDGKVFRHFHSEFGLRWHEMWNDLLSFCSMRFKSITIHIFLGWFETEQKKLRTHTAFERRISETIAWHTLEMVHSTFFSSLTNWNSQIGERSSSGHLHFKCLKPSMIMSFVQFEQLVNVKWMGFFIIIIF